LDTTSLRRGPLPVADAQSAKGSGLVNFNEQVWRVFRERGHPSTGEFLTVDPAGAQTGEPYAYAGGDPVNVTDRTGLCPTWEVLSPIVYADCIFATEAGHLWNSPGSGAPQGEPIICETAAQSTGDADGFTAVQVNDYFSETLAGAGTWQLPPQQLAQEIGVATSGAIDIIYIDEFGGPAGGWGALKSSNNLLLGAIGVTSGWTDWTMHITTADFYAGAAVLGLDEVVTHAASYGLSGVESYLLGKMLGLVLPSPNPTPTPTPTGH